MSDLVINFKNPYLACPDGLTVEAWLASNFLHSPISTDAYPPGGSPAASGTTSGGSCTLTGLSADAYQVSIIDESAKPTFFSVPAAYIGGGTFTARYTPDPVTTPTPTWPEKFLPSLSDSRVLPTGWPVQGIALNQATVYQNNLQVPVIIYALWYPSSSSSYDSFIVEGSDDASTWAQLARLGQTQFSTGTLFQDNYSSMFIVPVGSYIQWSEEPTANAGLWVADHWYYSF